MTRRICIVTGTRAEYGLLFWLMKEIQSDPSLQLQIVATGMHLSPAFGLTYKNIEADGFKIDRKVEMLVSSDTGVGAAKSTGLGTIGMADAFSDLQPDLIVGLGDRLELLSAATAALALRIPLAHLAGGDTTEGAFDESIRHAVSKMSHVHFPFSETARKRLLQLGEDPAHVFNFGSTGIDAIVKSKLLDRVAFEKAIGFSLGKRNLLVTYHPVTLEPGSASKDTAALLQALDKQAETKFIFTKANSDPEGLAINKLIDEFVARQPQRAVAFDSLGQLRYLSALKHADGVIGNSSSGLLEAPSFGKGTVNIGDRQKGRERATSVIDCEASADAIAKALTRLYSPEFQAALVQIKNPYGTGGASSKIKDVLKSVVIKDILKKRFVGANL